MKFDFDEDQQFIRNDARRFLVDRCPMEDVRQHLDSDPGVISPLWQEICELGWLGVAIPEAYGGLGMGYLELCVLAEELGRVVAPVPRPFPIPPPAHKAPGNPYPAHHRPLV